ncbi:MAG TPA: S24/S26 family peptidase [Candidatus Sulfotelmatobacter sp.]|nr:S24/S26 family peptidase [Candidatus Sulfotelmatobacter sp.]
MKVFQDAHDQAHALKCELACEVLRLSGYVRLRVRGWSMLPTIWPGDTLELEKAECGKLSAGDVVLFHRDRRLFVHRMLNSDGNTIFTQGDAMAQPDPVVTERELLGRVTCIVRDGKRIQPTKTLSLSHRAVAAVARSSEFGARVIVGMRGLLQ